MTSQRGMVLSCSPRSASLLPGMRGQRSKSTSVPPYVVVSPCFGRAAVDFALSRLCITEPVLCMECRSTGVESVHGFVLEPGTWRGEDIFRARGLRGFVVFSERFARLVERNGLTNMVLTPIEQFVWDPSKLGPPSS